MINNLKIILKWFKIKKYIKIFTYFFFYLNLIIYRIDRSKFDRLLKDINLILRILHIKYSKKEINGTTSFIYLVVQYIY
jgi:hypothetical protein